MFKKVDPKLDLVKVEHEVMDFWDKNKIQEKYLHKNEKSKEKFSFLDGPITANNPMGVHHAWGRTYKDLWQRYNTMLGKKQRYQNGFDCQGLWVEVEVEKELGFKTKKDIEDYGIDKFVEKCKERVLKYSTIQTEQSKRLGYFMDWDNSYFTMADENNYMIWHFLKTCHKKGYLYKGHDVVPWCTRCGTAISQHEILTEEYKELTHPSIFVKLPIEGKENDYFLVWTTTPWTLTSNIALAVNPDLEYVKAKVGNEYYWISKAALSVIEQEYKIEEKVRGKKLLGLSYKGPFDELEAQKGVVHKVIPWDEVGEDEGTGIVHIAPGCGEEDFQLGKLHNLDVIAPLDDAGNYLPGFGDLSGKSVNDVRDAIFENLKSKRMVYRIHDYTHRYPTCWRCKEELVFRLVDEWYIAMDKKDPDDKKGRTLREQMIDVAKKIKWIPSFGLDRELDWLNNMHDWLISKKRYWGLALPIYECSNCGNFEVIGSKDELQKKSVSGWESFQGQTPHRPWVDNVKIKCSKCNENVSRVEDVGNPWLDAGIVPFSTIKKENKGEPLYLNSRNEWKEWFPVQFITESFPGQFKNWFYAMIAMSTVLEDTNPYQTVLGFASVRDEKGEEMHKSKGNAIWFDDAAEEIGVDVMRWMYAKQNPVQNLNFGYHSANEVRRKILTLWNVYSFFITYAALDDWKPNKATEVPIEKRSVLDRWILSELNELVDFSGKEFSSFRAHTAMEKYEKFIDELSTWYVRRSRRRFWKSEDDIDKDGAYQTLYEVLITLCKLLAPVVPHLSETMYKNLGGVVESVHLDDWPKVNKKAIDKDLEKLMEKTRDVVNLGLSVRADSGIKVRQPLNSVTYGGKKLSQELESIIAEELNVKEVKYSEKLGEIREVEEAKPIGLELDTKITQELKNEGIARDFVRFIQDGRKKANFNVEDRIETAWEISDKETSEAITNFSEYIAKETLSEKFENKKGEFEYSETVKLNGQEVWFGISRK